MTRNILYARVDNFVAVLWNNTKWTNYFLVFIAKGQRIFITLICSWTLALHSSVTNQMSTIDQKCSREILVLNIKYPIEIKQNVYWHVRIWLPCFDNSSGILSPYLALYSRLSRFPRSTRSINMKRVTNWVGTVRS